MDPCVRVCRGTFWPIFFFLEMTRKPTIFQKTTTFLLVVFLKNVYSLTPSWYFWHNVSYKVKTCRSGHLCPPHTHAQAHRRAQTNKRAETHRRTDAQTCRRAEVQTHTRADAPTPRRTHAQTHAYTDAYCLILFSLSPLL